MFEGREIGHPSPQPTSSPTTEKNGDRQLAM